MINLRWQSVRSILLAITFTSISLVLWQTFFNVQTNKKEKTTPTPFLFPATVPLASWQQITANTLKAINKNYSINGQQYKYIYQEKTLEIQAHYEPYTDGNVSRLLVVYTPIEPATVNLNLRYQEDVGYYSLFADAEKLYLSACINSKGESTVTEQQFIHNRYSNDLTPQRVFWWLLGQKDLLDVSCLWTLASTPLHPEVRENSNLLTKNIEVLEAAWFDWYSWWQTQLIHD